MSQITIRDLAPQVEALVRQRASKEGVSMSRTISEMLAELTGLKPMDKRYRDLSALSGTWSAVEAAEFNRTQEYFGQIDEEVWK